MNTEKTNWKEEVIQSMQDSQKAKPNPAVFAKIQEKIATSNAKVIPMYRLKQYAAAVVLIIFINAAAVISFNQNEELQTKATNEIELSNRALITSFQFY